ncbi:MAG: glycosyltransferase family 9 protein [Cruoricaptor ignavus]|nr:glycosyltransferase family 9 protein [Cruoricaptor ignavus]
MKILVIQKKLMGDVLVCSVVFRLLKERFPNAELHYLIDEKYLQVVDNHRFIDKFLFFDKDIFKTIALVRKEKYDVVIDTYSKIETALISLFSKAKKRISYHKSYTQFFYTHPIHRKKIAVSKLTTSTIEHRLQLLEPLGIDFKITKPEIFITEQEKTNGQNILKKYTSQSSKKVMISTFGSSPEKTYPLPYMAKIIEEIAETENVELLLNYLPHQKEMLQELFSILSEKANSKIAKDFDTKNLREYISVLSFCDGLVGNEGGSTNISKALGVPTFTVFSPFIAKESWNWFDDGIKNISVHLHDYIPENQSYQDFKPEFFQDELRKFILNNLK